MGEKRLLLVADDIDSDLGIDDLINSDDIDKIRCYDASAIPSKIVQQPTYALLCTSLPPGNIPKEDAPKGIVDGRIGVSVLYAIQEIRQNVLTHNIPIVVYSFYPNHGVFKKRCMELGATNVLKGAQVNREELAKYILDNI